MIQILHCLLEFSFSSRQHCRNSREGLNACSSRESSHDSESTEVQKKHQTSQIKQNVDDSELSMMTDS